VWHDLILLLDATLRVAVPLVFAAMAGIFAERSGVIDFGLEGKMLAGAFVAGALAHWTQSAWIGVLGAMVVGVMLSMVHGLVSVTKSGNQVVSCVAINEVARGLTVVLAVSWFTQGGKTPQLPQSARFTAIELPFAEELRGVPILGEVYAELISGHNILVYLAFLAVPLTAWILYRTRFGLRLRATGENPLAVDTAGISVQRMRYQALMINGLLGGISGAYLSTAQIAFFVKDMSAGKGYFALAAMIFGKWRPVPAMFACLLFAFLESAGSRMQGTPLPVLGTVPVPLIQSLPYLLTVVLLAGFVGKAIAPKAIGEPFVKERK
jgi:ABC-type uncharacterized transport system permease subunit